MSLNAQTLVKELYLSNKNLNEKLIANNINMEERINKLENNQLKILRKLELILEQQKNIIDSFIINQETTSNDSNINIKIRDVNDKLTQMKQFIEK
jgi:hypothetical protein